MTLIDWLWTASASRSRGGCSNKGSQGFQNIGEERHHRCALLWRRRVRPVWVLSTYQTGISGRGVHRDIGAFSEDAEGGRCGGWRTCHRCVSNVDSIQTYSRAAKGVQ